MSVNKEPMTEFLQSAQNNGAVVDDSNPDDIKITVLGDAGKWGEVDGLWLPVSAGDEIDMGMTISTGPYDGDLTQGVGARMNIDLYIHAPEGMYGIATIDEVGTQAADLIQPLINVNVPVGSLVPPGQADRLTQLKWTVPTQDIEYITIGGTNEALGTPVFQWYDANQLATASVYKLSTPVKVDSLIFGFWSPLQGLSATFSKSFLYVNASAPPVPPTPQPSNNLVGLIMGMIVVLGVGYLIVKQGKT